MLRAAVILAALTTFGAGVALLSVATLFADMMLMHGAQPPPLHTADCALCVASAALRISTRCRDDNGLAAATTGAECMFDPDTLGNIKILRGLKKENAQAAIAQSKSQKGPSSSLLAEDGEDKKDYGGSGTS